MDVRTEAEKMLIAASLLKEAVSRAGGDLDSVQLPDEEHGALVKVAAQVLEDAGAFAPPEPATPESLVDLVFGKDADENLSKAAGYYAIEEYNRLVDDLEKNAGAWDAILRLIRPMEGGLPSTVGNIFSRIAGREAGTGMLAAARATGEGATTGVGRQLWEGLGKSMSQPGVAAGTAALGTLGAMTVLPKVWRGIRGMSTGGRTLNVLESVGRKPWALPAAFGAGALTGTAVS